MKRLLITILIMLLILLCIAVIGGIIYGLFVLLDRGLAWIIDHPDESAIIWKVALAAIALIVIFIVSWYIADDYA